MTEQTLWQCPNCQAPNAAGYFFCSVCDAHRPDRSDAPLMIVLDRFRQVADEYLASIEDGKMEAKRQLKALNAADHFDFGAVATVQMQLDDLRQRKRAIRLAIETAEPIIAGMIANKPGRN
jgi:hypothetical protein